jgi:cytochrome c peroxidase
VKLKKYKTMKKTLLFSIIIFVIAVISNACHKKSEAIMPEQPISFERPSNFPAPLYDLSRNPVNKAGFELGRALFYDGILSRDGTISCGSCHQQPSAFTQHGHDLSHGIDDQLTLRNSLPIMNLAWKPLFFWDGGVFDLDLFAIAPIEAHNEMDNTVSNVLTKLRSTQKYPKMFEKAFGTTEITSDRFLKALSQFQLMCISSNSKYDKIMRNEGESFTPDELAGKNIFEQKCATCHEGVFFTNNQFINNGLPIGNPNDTGRERITWQVEDKFKFRVPSLRNVEVSHPYMHDGRFRTLQAVLDFYSNGVVDSPTLDSRLRQSNGNLGIPLTATEKTQLIAFLKTLTDNTYLTDPKLAEQ